MNRAVLALVLGIAGLGAAAIGFERATRGCTGRCAAPVECAVPEVLAPAVCEGVCTVKLEAEPARGVESASAEVRSPEPAQAELPAAGLRASPATPTLVAAGYERMFDEIQSVQKRTLLLAQEKSLPTAQLKELKLANAKVELLAKAGRLDPALLAQLKRSGPAAAVAPVKPKTKPGIDPAQKVAPLK